MSIHCIVNRLFPLFDSAAIRLRWMLMKIIWPFMVAVFVNFFLTLLLFPGITTLVQECSLGGWTPIILVVVFNTTDLVGKVNCMAWHSC